MSTDQKIFTNALEEVANDLHAQHQLQIEALKAEHNKEKTALIEEIQAAGTCYQELKSKHQKDVDCLSGELAKHSKSDRDTVDQTDESVAESSDPFQYDGMDDFLGPHYWDSSNLEFFFFEISEAKRDLMQTSWKLWEFKSKNKEEFEKAYEVRLEREFARYARGKAKTFARLP